MSVFGQDKDHLLNTEMEIDIAKPGAMEDFGHLGIISNMADVLQNWAEPLVKPEEMLNVAAIIEAFYLSAKEKREIKAEELGL